MSRVSYKADVEWHAPGSAPGGTVTTVEEDGEKETLAALAADPDREPLARESGEIQTVSGPHTVTYQNDAINRLSMTDNNLGLPINFSPNHLNQYTSVTGHGALNYDGNLNVSGYDGWAFVHDAEKRLLSVTGNGHSAQFAYDGLGRCVRRTIDGATTVFTYDEWQPVAEWTGVGAFLAWNLYGAGPDEILVRYQQNPTGYLHYHLDAMGNVQFLLSDQPNPGLEKYTYDVFGKPTIIGWNGDVRPISNHGNRFLFTGREYLYTFGLYDYRHRIYHPGLGRFIQIDPLGFDGDPLNLYRYCGSNPINHSDPMGLTDSTKEPERMAPDGWYAEAADGRIYKPTQDNFGPDATGTTDRIIAEIPREPGTSWAPGDWRPNDRGVRNAGSGHGNPYRESAPFIAHYGKGFDNYNLQAHAEFWETFAEHVPEFIPLGGIARMGSGLRRAGTVIGRLKDLQRLRPGETSLLSRMPNLGNHNLNWAQNARVLRQEMNRGLPIRDASLGRNGGYFLTAERNLLSNHGWTRDAMGYWMPPP